MISISGSRLSQPHAVSDDAAMVDSRAAKKVLIVENKHLNPENEMKRIFGSRVVASEANQRQKKGRGGRGHQVLVSHWLILITLISDWSILITLISE